jgi:hypothetical protein
MQDIENILTNAANEHRVTAPTEAWPFIADALHKRKKRRAAWLFLALFVVVFIATSSLYFYSEKGNKNNIDKSSLSKKINNTKETISQVEDDIEKYHITDSALATSNLNIKNSTNPTEKNELTNNFTKNKFSKSKIVAKHYEKSNKEQEQFFEKNKIIEKIKSRTKVRITPIIKLEEIEEIKEQEIAVATKETKADEKVNNKNIIIKERVDSSKNNITKININPEIEKNTLKEKIATKKENKWHSYLSINTGALFLNSKSFLKTENTALYATQQSASTTSSSQLSSTNIALANANYQTGKQISLSFLLKKENKKFQPQFGAYLNYAIFNLKAYKASAALLDATSQTLDSSQSGNSLYAAKSSSGSNALKVKNNFVQIGISIGASISLYSFKQNNKILLQTQVIPTFNLSQSIQWYDKSSTRYFTSKKLDHNFNITQSTALLWQTNINKRTLLFGSYFNFNYFKINKSLNNISNIYAQSLGLQFQFKLKNK